MLRAIIFALLTSLPAYAEGKKSGDFDYYVLALSWSPTWCKLTGDNRNADQCDSKHDYGFIVHGLWPQYEQGWPSYCRSKHRAPSRSMTSAQSDFMGSGGSAWHQWKKHGSCSGLSAQEYYNTAKEAYSQFSMPAILRQVTEQINLPAKVVEQAFLEENQNLEANQITITCKQNHIQEARICLTKDLAPRKCGSDVIRDCTSKNAILAPVR